MWSFFHGWRRKAGVVTLGLACVLTSGWIRSLWLQDWIMLPASRQRVLGCVTEPGLVGVVTETHGEAQPVSAAPIWTSEPIGKAYDNGGSLFECDKTNRMRWVWRWQRLGFARGGEQTDVFTWFTIPHWMIVFPLTLLSAYLILWKPRKSKSSDQPAISNLISN